MASFLQNLINNATNSMSEGIKKRVDDGTFNRLASDFGRGINSLGAGMVNLVSKAEGVFGKLKDKVAEAKANREQERAERKAEQEDRERKAEQLRAERLAMIEKGSRSRLMTKNPTWHPSPCPTTIWSVWPATSTFRTRMTCTCSV